MNRCACGYEGKNIRDLVDHILFMVTIGQETFDTHYELINN